MVIFFLKKTKGFLESLKKTQDFCFWEFYQIEVLFSNFDRRTFASFLQEGLLEPFCSVFFDWGIAEACENPLVLI